jgi:hypothetical protein
MVTIPHSLDDNIFDTVLLQIEEKQSPVYIDLKNTGFIDPYGMIGLLQIGRSLNSVGIKPFLFPPKSTDVLNYLKRMDFFKFTNSIFTIESHSYSTIRSIGYSDVLLEITSIEKSDDIHAIVDKVMERAHTILTTHLNYDENTIHGFVVALSEVCQNIIEHSQTTGLVGIQKYFFQKVLGKNVVKIAVMDLGIGFKSSLAKRFSSIYGKDCTDIKALEWALLHGASRYEDIGRGHGLAAVKRFIEKWKGKLSIRSGTAKISIIPNWDTFGKTKQTDLPFFSGTQIGIILPAL